jgi:glucose/mannose transport system substrate-binding protein
MMNDSDSEELDDIDRRTYMKVVGAASAAGITGIAGCLGGNGGGNGSGSGGSGGTNKPLEVLHGWTGGDGAKAVQALTEGFKTKHPDMKTNFKPIGGGGNVNLNSVVARRLSNQNPPSSFAGWPGANLVQYEGTLMDIGDSVWKQAGLEDPIIDPAQKKSKLKGKYVTMPLGSHRMNNLFFNKQVLNKAGVDPASLKSVDDMIGAFKKIKQKTGKVPLAHAMKAPWLNLQFWVEVFLSEYGKKAYIDFTKGKGDKKKVRKSLQSTKTILKNYINSDASSIGFTTANQKVMRGDAATIHNGNWLYGMYRNKKGFKYNKDWGWAPFPGTGNMYVFHLDSFIVPANNPSPQKVKKWERYVGSKEAQIAFNKRKGSVPVRNDIDPKKLPEYLTLTYNDLLNANELPPTMAHGLAVPKQTLGDVKSAIGDNFMGPYKVDAAAKALMKAVQGQGE